MNDILNQKQKNKRNEGGGINYSVLLAVYKGEKPLHLYNSINSILYQTLIPTECIVVCDGVLTKELYAVLEQLKQANSILNIIQLPKNNGLGQALNIGLTYCHNEFVVRMDSDDISLPNRCEKQLNFMQNHGLDLCSAAVEEFVGELQITGRHALPIYHDEIVRFSKTRNPMNHPCVVFKKSMVEKAGGYRQMPYFEDYDLWVRMILVGAKLGNLSEPLLYMRAGEDFYNRRSGFRYCKHIVHFWREMCCIGFCGRFRAWSNVAVRCIVSLLPIKGVQYFYQNKLRTKPGEHDEAL